MIAGETERVLRRELEGDYYNYDNLFGINKNKAPRKRTKRVRTAKVPLTEEERGAKKEKRQKFWSSIGDGIKDSGGISGILGMISPKKEVQQDYRTSYAPIQEENTPSNTTDNTKIAMYVGGGLGALFVGYLVLTAVKNSKTTATVPVPLPANVTPV